jgi:hypothetical protein
MRDDSWFHEASARFFRSLWLATIIIVAGTPVVYLMYPLTLAATFTSSQRGPFWLCAA